MRIFGRGLWENVIAQVDPLHAALRTSLRPAEPGVLGSYTLALPSGVMAAALAAASPVFAFQWLNKNVNALIRRVRVIATTDGTAFAQGSAIFDLIRATAFTAQYTAGQTLNLLGKSQARATRMSASQQSINNVATGAIAIANTATLSAGAPAPTLDNNAIGILLGSVGASPALTLASGYLIDPTEAARTPLEVMLNEGFVIRATVPITGTFKFGVEVDWDEIDPGRYYN
jgi:hypothetical protein